MNNLKDYILHLDNWIPKNICKKTIKELSSYNWERHKWTSTQSFQERSVNGNKELDICYGNKLFIIGSFINNTKIQKNILFLF